MMKAKPSSNVWLFSTAFSVFFVSLIHPSSLQEQFEKRSFFPDGVDRRLFINSQRGQWNGFRLPKDSPRPLHSLFSPVNELSTLLNTRKELEESVDPDPSIAYKDYYLDDDNLSLDSANSQLNEKKESEKNIFPLMGSIPESSGNGWELEFPKGRKGTTQWIQNLFNADGLSQMSSNVHTDQEKDEKRPKRDATILNQIDLCRRYLRLC